MVTSPMDLPRVLEGNGRNPATQRSAIRAETRFYDLEHQIELGSVSDAAAMSPRGFMEKVRDACREPTSLEILYYAQVGGPHVRGEPC